MITCSRWSRSFQAEVTKICLWMNDLHVVLPFQGQTLEFHQCQHVCTHAVWVIVPPAGFVMCVCVLWCSVCLSCIKVKVTARSNVWLCGFYFALFQVRRGQRTVQTETKYIELMVVNDYELVSVNPAAPTSSLLPCLSNRSDNNWLWVLQ